MKRFLKYFSILLAFTFMLTGCGKVGKDAKKELVDAIKKTSEAKSVKEKVNATANFDVEGNKINVDLSGDLESYKENDEAFTVHGKFKAGAMGMSYDAELYFDSNKDGLAMYMNFLGQWMKSEKKYTSDELKQVEQYKNILKEMKNLDYSKVIKSAKTAKEDKKGYKKLDVVLDKDKINEEFKSVINKEKEEILNQVKAKTTNPNEVAKIEKEMNEAFKLIESGIVSEDIKLTMYLKNKYVAIVEIDGASLIKSVIGGFKSILGSDAEVNKSIDSLTKDLKFDISVELSDFDKVEKINIPTEAKNGKNMDNKDANINPFSSFGA